MLLKLGLKIKKYSNILVEVEEALLLWYRVSFKIKYAKNRNYKKIVDSKR